MRREGPSSVTVEEAVSEMVNMDYIPAGLTLLDILAAFQEEAEVEHHNAKIDRLPEEQIKVMEIRMYACQERYALAELLIESLQHEVDHRKDSMIVLADESFGKQRLTFESVSDWAADRYGIGISRPRPRPRPQTSQNPRKNAVWEDVTIKIWADHKIGYKFEGDKVYKKSNFSKISLIDRRNNEANTQGIILIGLSQGKKFPTGGIREGKDSGSIKRLRDALVKLTRVTDDPFEPYNKHDGWKPRFKLIDDRKNADERAERKAIHVPYNETVSNAPYDDED